ncbi:PepSY domain-containing protein [Rhizobium oryzicola]|uniref:PepSY domain-containing protein n=1 Tax=Rhizobium oryzicola TaxID=1232668 RepID=A0ABT8T1B2_9HYPH|nr:PepSY domain-containing protein [Rhizobium oryzicola]MDO1583672.1 PepSY domain-containing protein [Rhizobium oryzicola]
MKLTMRLRATADFHGAFQVRVRSGRHFTVKRNEGRTRLRIFISLSVVLIVIANHAFASEKCHVPVADWQPRTTLRMKLEGEGWKVRTIHAEDGCYEAFAVNPNGQTVEASFNPKSLETVEVRVPQ